MKLLYNIAYRLRYPVLRDTHVDSPEYFFAQEAVIAKKESIRRVFRADYSHCFGLEKRYLLTGGMRLELGSGPGFVKDLDPGIVTTDLKPGPRIDKLLDAQSMDLADGSVSTVFAFNVFHHLDDPATFFHELERVLIPGGGAIMLDPYHGPVARVVFKHLFRTETFNMKQMDWKRPRAGAMSGANQALGYVVFHRDLEKFRGEHPGLELVHKEVLNNYFSYLISGGINFRQLLPDWAFGAVRLVERMTSPMRGFFGIHQVVVIRKRQVK
jgi:SAM-dependent methyltransferase